MKKPVIPAPVSGTPSHATRLPLVKDFHRLAASPGAKCGNCGKPFNAIRKPALLLATENEAPGRGVVVSEYLLCRACKGRYQREGAGALSIAFQDAEDAARLALSPVEGRA